MKPQPTLATDRLVLRPFQPADASAVQALAGNRAIADITLSIPHPYEDGMAEEWIASHPARYEAGEQVNFAVVERDTGNLVGAIGLMLEPRFNRAEMGYWIGVPYWGRGYGTEAARAILRYGFEERGLVRIHAHHLARNPASGRVMQKIGMTREGRLRRHVRKWDRYEDVELYAILNDEWPACETLQNRK